MPAAVLDVTAWPRKATLLVPSVATLSVHGSLLLLERENLYRGVLERLSATDKAAMLWYSLVSYRKYNSPYPPTRRSIAAPQAQGIVCLRGPPHVTESSHVTWAVGCTLQGAAT
eukprot:1026906-Rhodomonas_salina.1